MGKHNLNIHIMRFREFLQDDGQEEKQDIHKTLAKLPPSHAALVKGFRWKFQSGNTLHADDEHIGYMDDGNKEIAVAAPWNYGREFTILHEIAHKIWERLPPTLQHHWNQLVTHTRQKHGTSDPLDQPAEELFCMAYAQFFAHNKITKFDFPEWHKFIEGLPK